MKFHPIALRNRIFTRFAKSVKAEIGVWNFREIARRLDVNNRYVTQYIQEGKVPPNTTEEGRQVRLKMWIDRPRKPRRVTPRSLKDTPDAEAWYRHQQSLERTLKPPSPKKLAKHLQETGERWEGNPDH